MRKACSLLLLSLACCALCYPSKPLNERSTELAWQAWLLVDQAARPEAGVSRRKITPKSVFIAPTFSPESLPACAEGYRSDPMGRCVRIIKINESFHLNFLLERLNQQFPADREEEPTPGPLQINIPLAEEANETDVAIVVAPSSAGDRSASVQVEVRRNGSDKFDVEDVAAVLRVKPESVEMTTIEELSTTVGTTTVRGEEEGTTLESSTVVDEESGGSTSTTESGEMSTLFERDAVFFQLRI